MFGVLSSFGGVLFVVVMVWVLSGVVGDGWFWGVEGLGFWGVLFFVVMVWVLSGGVGVVGR